MIPKEYIELYLPAKFEHLTKVNKIEYKGVYLKSAYLISLMNEFIQKFYLTSETKFNLYSKILKLNYGKHYNYYVEYLVDNGFWLFTSDYFVGRKAKTYRLNNIGFDNIKSKITDTTIIKKHSKEYQFKNNLCDNPIETNIKTLIVEDLYHVEIDYENAKKWLDEQKHLKKIEVDKYLRNQSSIKDISTGYLFFKFDNYGRFHTNYTILKRFIRKNFLTIDGKATEEVDISNSQPFFFVQYLKNKIGEENFSDELKRYQEIVYNGLIYDYFMEKYPRNLVSRKQAKTMIYKVLFGDNKDKSIHNRLFTNEFPQVYQYIRDAKVNNYKELSHKLQLLESNFIYNVVVKDIKKRFPHIRLFTVHDSIVYPVKYKNEVELIFNHHLRMLKS